MCPQIGACGRFTYNYKSFTFKFLSWHPFDGLSFSERVSVVQQHGLAQLQSVLC